MPTSNPQTWSPSLYQDAHAFVWQKAADLVELLAPKSGEHILDLGCGTGQLTALIADRGATVVGIDRSTEMVDQARRNFPDLKFEISDATMFAAAEPFDAVFSNATLHWVKPPEAAAGRIRDALRPGGRFVAEFGGKGNVERISGALRAALRDVAGIDFDAIDPWYYPSVGEYASLLERHGLAVTFATLLERPTPLEGGEEGLRNWVRMFGAGLLEHVPPERREAVLEAVCEQARAALFRDGGWFADYVRLRVIARRR